MNSQMAHKCFAEAIGTFWLTFGGCGSAVIAAGFPAGRHRVARRLARLRADRADHGLCDRPYLRLPSQPGRHGRARGRRPFSGRATSCPTSSRRSSAPSWRGRALCDRQRRAGFHSARGFAANGYGDHSPGHYG